MNSIFFKGLILFCLGTINAQVLFSQGLVINELLASNDDNLYDDFFEFNDWIEIYNSSGSIVNLAGYYLSDDLDSLDKWEFPNTNPGITTILTGGHVLIWCDKDPEQGEDHADFSLSGDGETVYLVDTDGVSILDSIAFGQQQTDISYGRSCDGCEDWIYYNTPTPQAVNESSTLPAYLVLINEWQVENSSTLFDEVGDYDAWVEIFNPNDFQVNLSGYEFKLDTDSYFVSNDSPWLTTIEPNGYLVFWLDGEAEQGANHLELTSVPSNGVLSIHGSDGLVIDAIEWEGSTPFNSSYGRSLDGSPSWTEFAIPTPRVTNSLQIIPGGPIVINEIQSFNVSDIQDNLSEYEDWLELHNPTDSPIDIAGYFVSDRIDNPQKWMVPVGFPDFTVVEPGGYVILFADDDESQGWNHMNFKFNNAGEHAALRSPDGFTVLDSLDIPALAADLSWGRLFDAGSPWVEFTTTTPNASNGTADVNPIDALGQWTPFPNPIQSGHTFSFPESGFLYDAMGRLVLQWPRAGKFPMPKTKGLYIIQLRNGRSARIMVSE
jgi:hypothetical protein